MSKTIESFTADGATPELAAITYVWQKFAFDHPAQSPEVRVMSVKFGAFLLEHLADFERIRAIVERSRA